MAWKKAQSDYWRSLWGRSSYFTWAILFRQVKGIGTEGRIKHTYQGKILSAKTICKFQPTHIFRSRCLTTRGDPYFIPWGSIFIYLKVLILFWLLHKRGQVNLRLKFDGFLLFFDWDIKGKAQRQITIAQLWILIISLSKTVTILSQNYHFLIIFISFSYHF